MYRYSLAVAGLDVVTPVGPSVLVLRTMTSLFDALFGTKPREAQIRRWMIVLLALTVYFGLIIYAFHQPYDSQDGQPHSEVELVGGNSFLFLAWIAAVVALVKFGNAYVGMAACIVSWWIAWRLSYTPSPYLNESDGTPQFDSAADVAALLGALNAVFFAVIFLGKSKFKFPISAAVGVIVFSFTWEFLSRRDLDGEVLIALGIALVVAAATEKWERFMPWARSRAKSSLAASQSPP